MSDEPNAERGRQLRQLGIATTIPFVMLAAPAVGYVIGTWLDGRLGTAPTLRAVFVLLGVAAGVYETIQLIRKLQD